MWCLYKESTQLHKDRVKLINDDNNIYYEIWLQYSIDTTNLYYSVDCR